MALLEVRNLTKRFGDTQVLRGIDYTQENGEVVSVIGSSGGGKTTFLRCLNFLERPDAGTIRVGDNTFFDASKTYSEKEIREMRLHLGLVFQSFHLFPQYTAFQNVKMPLFLREVETLKRSFRGRELRAKKAACAEMCEMRCLRRSGLPRKPGTTPASSPADSVSGSPSPARSRSRPISSALMSRPLPSTPNSPVRCSG